MGMGDPTPPLSITPQPPAPVPAQPKSAFDDLEEVMRMSLGGSPAKQPQPITQQPVPQNPMQPFGDMQPPMGQPVFGSPARQPMGRPMGAICFTIRF